MLNDNDIVRVTVNQSLAGEDIKNVFFFLIEVLVAGITLIDILEDFQTLVWAFVRPLQVADIVATSMVAENLTNGIDVDTISVTLPGVDSTGGSVLPSYVAAGFRLNVSDKTTRPGGKRFAGIGEARVLDNDYNPDGSTGLVAEAALAVIFPIFSPTTGVGDGVPIVVGRNLDGSLNLSRFSLVATASMSSTIRSQVSRRAAVL